MSELREVIIPHVASIQQATHVRSTLLQSSLATLRGLGYFERYLSVLAPAMREPILGSLAPSWLPIELGVEHYRACSALELSDAQMLAMGEHVGDRMQGAFMETLTRTARTMGVTPWVLLKRFDVLWGRMFQGGSFELTRVGPKDLTIDIRRAMLPQSAYFRAAFCGVVRAGFKYVSAKAAVVRVTRWEAAQDRFVMRASWV